MASATSQISLAEAAERLGVHYMTAYRYVRIGRLPAVKDGREWRVDEADVEALRRGDTTTNPRTTAARTPTGTAATPVAHEPRDGEGPLGDAPSDASPTPDHERRARARRRDAYPPQLVERLTRADEAGSWMLVQSALASGMDPEHAYLDLFVPALQIIGARWANGELTVAEEHQASAIVLRLIGRMGPMFARRGRRRGTVLLGAPPMDGHGLPSALLSDVLRGRGFEVVDLGADVPADSWGSSAARATDLLAVGLCATTPGNEDGVAAAITAIRAASAAPILLGGGAIGSAADALDLGATAFSTSFADAVERIEQLAGHRAA